MLCSLGLSLCWCQTVFQHLKCYVVCSDKFQFLYCYWWTTPLRASFLQRRPVIAYMLLCTFVAFSKKHKGESQGCLFLIPLESFMDRVLFMVFPIDDIDAFLEMHCIKPIIFEVLIVSLWVKVIISFSFIASQLCFCVHQQSFYVPLNKCEDNPSCTVHASQWLVTLTYCGKRALHLEPWTCQALNNWLQ